MGVRNSARLVLFKCLDSKIYSKPDIQVPFVGSEHFAYWTVSLFSFVKAAAGWFKRRKLMKRLSSCILLEIVLDALVKFGILSFTQIMWQSTFRFIN